MRAGTCTSRRGRKFIQKSGCQSAAGAGAASPRQRRPCGALVGAAQVQTPPPGHSRTDMQSPAMRSWCVGSLPTGSSHCGGGVAGRHRASRVACLPPARPLCKSRAPAGPCSPSAQWRLGATPKELPHLPHPACYPPQKNKWRRLSTFGSLYSLPRPAAYTARAQRLSTCAAFRERGEGVVAWRRPPGGDASGPNPPRSPRGPPRSPGSLTAQTRPEALAQRPAKAQAPPAPGQPGEGVPARVGVGGGG